MSRSLPTLAAAVAALALAACDGAPTDAAGLTLADVQALAPAWDAVAQSAVDAAAPSLSADGAGTTDHAGPPPAGTTTLTFTRTRTCPLGGSTTLAGERTITHDPETRSGSMTMAATRTDDACTFSTRRHDARITVTGNPGVAVTVSHAWSGGVPGVRTSTQQGAFTWTRGDATGTCTVDLASTWDPATHTHTVQGTFCGRTVDVTRTRQH